MIDPGKAPETRDPAARRMRSVSQELRAISVRCQSKGRVRFLRCPGFVKAGVKG
jgi:hypothetical protein